MKTRHKVVIWIGLLLVLLLCISPPWTVTERHRRGYSTTNPAGHWFLMEPLPTRDNLSLRIDYARLGLECVTVGIAVAGFVLLTQSRKPGGGVGGSQSSKQTKDHPKWANET